MFKLTLLLLSALATAPAALANNTPEPAKAPVRAVGTDSAQLEKALQGLEWPQFKSVVEAVPQLKSQVDAYGKFGWQYVQANYRTYGWRKNIDKLDAEQKKQLGELIAGARNGSLPGNGGN